MASINQDSLQALRALVDPVNVVSSGAAIKPTPPQAQELAQVARAFLRARPDLAKLPISLRPTPRRGMYMTNDSGRGGIVVGEPSGAILGHELGHAENLEDASYYKTFLGAARSIANVANSLAIPAALAVRLLMEDAKSRNQVLNLMTGITAAANAPVLTEELGATLNALKRSENKWQDIKTLGPAFLSHLASAALPLASFQMARLI